VTRAALVLGALGVLARCGSSGGGGPPEPSPAADAGVLEAGALESGALDAGAKLVGFEDQCWSGQNAIVGSAAGRSGAGCSVCRSNPGLPFGMNSGGGLGHARAGVAYAVEAWVQVTSPSPGLTAWLRTEEESPATRIPNQTVDGPTLAPDAAWQRVSGQLTVRGDGDLLAVLVMANLDAAGSPCFVVDDVTVYGPLD
jgi:hypothetical protein